MHARMELLEHRRFLNAGQLDTTFGAAGHTELTDSSAAGTLSAVDLDATPGGQVVVTGVSRVNGTGPWKLHLRRLNSDGSKDLAFGAGGDGAVVLDMPASVPTFRIETVVTPNSRVLVAVGNLLYKFRVNGLRDNAFGTKGRLILRSITSPTDISVDDQGRIYAVGPDPVSGKLALARMNPNGSPDTTWGRGGVLLPPGGATPREFRVRVLIDGSIGVVGIAEPTGQSSEFTFGAYDVLAMKLRPNGKLDPSFDGDGIRSDHKISTDLTNYSASSPLLTPDGIFIFTQFGQSDPNLSLSIEGFDLGIKPIPSSLETYEFADDLLSDDAASVIVTRGVLHFLEGSSATAADSAAAAALGTFEPRKLAVQSDGTILVLSSGNSNAVPDTLAVHRLFRDDAPVGLPAVRTLTKQRNAGYYFTVQYRDDDGIDVASLGNDDITVAYPNGTRRRARLIRSAAAGKVVDARYRVTAGDGVWDNEDNGRYTIRIERRSVRDTKGNVAAQRTVGEFFVQIPGISVTPGAMPKAVASAATMATAKRKVEALFAAVPVA